MKTFASDNYSGVHPRILEAMARANVEHQRSYGYDTSTQAATEKFREQLGSNAEVHFVFTGTAANVLGLKAIADSFHAVICADISHLNVHECAAPEKFLGCKLISIPTRGGKLHPDDIAPHLRNVDEHYAQPKVVSITQASELGTVYTPQEVRALADQAHARGLYLHMDGSRLANAAASLNLPLRQITVDAGVDVLSFGGTKNGLMFGEAVVFFDPALGRNFKFIRKQGMQLGAKMRFLSAQFEELFRNELWREIAGHSNAMAKLLAEQVRAIPGIEIVANVEANVVFAKVPPKAIPAITEKYRFHVWDEGESVVRWMTSWDTTPEDVRDFARTIAAAVVAIR